MTQEEKAKRYDEALEKARQLCAYPTSKPFISDLQDLFPELADSEDERIRKAIYNAIKYLETELSWDFLGDVDILDAYAWLEKQGQTFTKKDVDDAYLEGMCVAKHELEKQSEQKPAWSEEDEKMLNVIIKDLVRPWNEYIPDRIEYEIKWLKNRLKSLKERYTWRPSDEQMRALEHFVRSIGESGYASPYDNDTKLLYSLLFDLKKLRGE